MADTKEYFFRQRRNLLALSILIIFYTLGDITFSEISLLGNVIAIAKPAMVTFSLWMFFFYFFWRYYVYCNKMRGVGEFKETYQNRLNERCLEIMKKRAMKISGIPMGEVIVKRADDKKNGMAFRVGIHTSIHNHEWLEKNEEKIKNLEKLNRRFDGLDYRWQQCRSLWTTALHYDVFSEYILPYLLAMLAMGVGLYTVVYNY